MRSLRRARRRSPPGDAPDAGFTLIELLVVMVIIGILAAIAVPVFLHQRQSAYDGEAKSDLSRLAKSEEAYLEETGVGYGKITEIGAVTPSRGVTLTVVTYDGIRGYCLSAKHANSSRTWFYDSQGGGLIFPAGAPCPATTSGIAGGQLTTSP